MKKFIIYVLCAAVFFIGLGKFTESVGAKFASDEKALTLIRQAREAIGGDAAINNIRSLTANGRISKTLNFNNSIRVEQGEWELSLQLPNQLTKKIRLGADTANGAQIKENVIVVVKNGDAANGKTVVTTDADGGADKVFIVKRDADETPSTDGEPHKKIVVNKNVRIGGGESGVQNELLRMTLGLLLTAPANANVTYAYAGEGVVDASPVEIVEANSGDAAIKLYLDKSSHLPRMMSFKGAKPMILHFKKGDGQPVADNGENVFIRRADAPEMTEFQVKFSDFKTVGGVQLPHKFVQTVGGAEDETIDIAAYELNPANIAEKFDREPTKIIIKTVKAQ